MLASFCKLLFDYVSWLNSAVFGESRGNALAPSVGNLNLIDDELAMSGRRIGDRLNAELVESGKTHLSVLTGV